MVEYFESGFRKHFKNVFKSIIPILIIAGVVAVLVFAGSRVAWRVTFLYDLRHFHRVLQNNFDLYDVAYRVRGTEFPI